MTDDEGEREGDQLGRWTTVAVEATQDGHERVLGFCDSFLTRSQEGLVRHEVDLLAVHPDSRGRGLAQSLIQESLLMASRWNVRSPAAPISISRALIRVGNLASERCFSQRGYQPHEMVCVLVTKEEPSGAHEGTALISNSTGVHLVDVQTFSYSGVWIEGSPSTEIFQSVHAPRPGQVVGAVLPLESQLLPSALSSGFHEVAQYRWWTCAMPPPS